MTAWVVHRLCEISTNPWDDACQRLACHDPQAAARETRALMVAGTATVLALTAPTAALGLRRRRAAPAHTEEGRTRPILHWLAGLVLTLTGLSAAAFLLLRTLLTGPWECLLALTLTAVTVVLAGDACATRRDAAGRWRAFVTGCVAAALAVFAVAGALAALGVLTPGNLLDEVRGLAHPARSAR